MYPTRRNLNLTLDALGAAMPKLMADHGETGGAEVFRSLADEILASAHSEDFTHVWSRLQKIQRDRDLIPGNAEPSTGGDGLPDDDAVSP